MAARGRLLLSGSVAHASLETAVYVGTALKYPLEYSRVDAIVAGADADAVDAADLADVVEVHCSKRKEGRDMRDSLMEVTTIRRLSGCVRTSSCFCCVHTCHKAPEADGRYKQKQKLT